MTSALYGHQTLGAVWLSDRRHGYLADQPGLGKTRTALAACGLADHRLPLVVCPAIVQSHWRREAAEMGLTPIVYSYDALVRGGARLKEQIEDQDPDALIVDEAHYCKHGTSQRTKVIFGKDGYARTLGVPVYALSGTPMPKNPDELWPVLCALFPRELRAHGIDSHTAYRAAFCVTRVRVIRGRRVEKIAAEIKDVPRFKALLADVMLARGLDDVGLDVPALDFQPLRLDPQLGRVPSYMGELVDQATESRAMVALLDGTLADIAADPHVARMRRRLGELKVGPVAEMLAAQLAGNAEKVCVFAHHRSVLDGLQALLQDFGVARIDGDTSPRDRELALERFQRDSTVRVFLGQNLACGTGTDGLQRATNRAVLVEPDWTAANNLQLGKRVARIGSLGTHAVCQMVSLAGTLDDAIVSQHWRETRLAATAGLS